MILTTQIQIEKLVKTNFEKFHHRRRHHHHDVGQTRRLEKAFSPGPNDVICARGKHAKKHPGNQKFRRKITELTNSYANADSRLYKSLVVSAVINYIRKASPAGGFVKEIDGEWFEVGDHQAREKTGQAFRNQLHTCYKSSTKSKRRRWKKEKEEKSRDECCSMQCDDAYLYKMVECNDQLNRKMKQIDILRLKAGGEKASDELMMEIFTQNNSSILQILKKDCKLKKGIQRPTIVSNTVSN
jgi:hypothetical protein